MVAMLSSLAAGIAAAQTAPAKEAPKTPSADVVVGHYRFQSGLIMSIQQSGDKLTVKSTGQQPQYLTPSDDGRFSYASGQASLSFDLDPSGKGKTLHIHFDDRSLPATRIDDATAQKVNDALELKIKNQTHDPACATTLKRLIEELRAGKPDYSKMTLALAQATRTQLPMLQPRVLELGALKEVKFTSVFQTGAEVFDATFENGTTQWLLFCLPNGYVSTAAFR